MKSPEQVPTKRAYNPAQESIKLFTAEGMTTPRGRREHTDGGRSRISNHYEMNHST
jgi:hypothetical protein